MEQVDYAHWLVKVSTTSGFSDFRVFDYRFFYRDSPEFEQGDVSLGQNH